MRFPFRLSWVVIVAMAWTARADNPTTAPANLPPAKLLSVHVKDADAADTIEKIVKEMGYSELKRTSDRLLGTAGNITLDLDQRPAMEVLLAACEACERMPFTERNYVMLQVMPKRSPKVANTCFSGPLAMQLMTAQRQDTIEYGGRQRKTSSVEITSDLMAEPAYAVLDCGTIDNIEATDSQGNPLKLALENHNAKPTAEIALIRASAGTNSINVRFSGLPSTVASLKSLKFNFPVRLASGEKVVEIKDPSSHIELPADLGNGLSVKVLSFRVAGNILNFETEFTGDRDSITMLRRYVYGAGRFGLFWVEGDKVTPLSSGITSSSNTSMKVRHVMPMPGQGQPQGVGAYRVVMPERDGWYSVPVQWNNVVLP